MSVQKEKLRELMFSFDRFEKDGAAGEHLRDQDFIRLVGLKKDTIKNGNLPAEPVELAMLRKHLFDCSMCLDKFQDFYAFFAPAETNEPAASKQEIAAAWQSFAPRISEKKQTTKFGERLFPNGWKFNFSAALGWSFAALFFILSGFGFYAAQQAHHESLQLAAQIENHKQQSETNPKALEKTEPNDISTELEKARLKEENDKFQKQIARLENEIELSKLRPPQAAKDLVTPPLNRKKSLEEKSDNSLVAVNTPIYDVYPSDLNLRGDGQSPNKIAVPKGARSVVLILNATGRADVPNYRAELVDSSGKIIWRGAGLQKDSTDHFTLTLAGALLKTGNYRLSIFGAGKTGSQTIAAYSISVEIK